MTVLGQSGGRTIYIASRPSFTSGHNNFSYSVGDSGFGLFGLLTFIIAIPMVCLLIFGLFCVFIGVMPFHEMISDIFRLMTESWKLTLFWVVCFVLGLFGW